LADIGVDRLRRGSEEAEAVVLDLLADGGVAVALKDVVDGLGGDDLREGGHERRVAELPAHPGDLGLDVGPAGEGAAVAQRGHSVAHRGGGGETPESRSALSD